MVLSSVSAVAVACCHLLPLPLHLLLSSVYVCSRLFTFGCIRIRIRTYSIISVSVVALSGPGPVIRIWSLVSISGPCRILSCHLVLYPGTVVWVRYIWSCSSVAVLVVSLVVSLVAGLVLFPTLLLVLHPGPVSCPCYLVRYIWPGPVPVPVTKRLHLLPFPFSVSVPVTKRSGPLLYIFPVYFLTNLIRWVFDNISVRKINNNLLNAIRYEDQKRFFQSTRASRIRHRV